MLEPNPYQSPGGISTPGPKSFSEVLERLNIQNQRIADYYHDFRSTHPSILDHEENFLLFLLDYLSGNRELFLPDITVSRATFASTIGRCLLHPVESTKRIFSGKHIASPSLPEQSGYVDFDALFNCFVVEKNLRCATRPPIPSAFQKKGQLVGVDGSRNDKLRISDPIRYGGGISLSRDNSPHGYSCSSPIIGYRMDGPDTITLFVHFYKTNETREIRLELLEEDS